jgi:amidase
MKNLDGPAAVVTGGATGRTNLPDFALRWHTDSYLRGPTRNPWDAGRSPGGSSGGEAAAIASGMSPLGFGNDLGGSVRVPAQFCGICSIRPTRGRVAQHVATMPAPPLSIELFNSVRAPVGALHGGVPACSRPGQHRAGLPGGS